MAKIIIGVISVIVIIVSIAIAGYSVNNLVNSDEKLLQNPKVQANLLEISDAGNQILDGCMNMEASLPMLETCKTTYMPELIESCQDSIIATLELCSDPRIQEFESTIDQRIDDKRQYVAALELELTEIQKRIKELQEHKIESLEKPPSDIFEYANQSILELIDTCLARDELSQNCIDTARQILQQCALDSTVPACGDPRLSEIANYGISEQNVSEVTEPTTEYESEPSYSPSIHATVDCIPSNDPTKFLAKVTVKNQDTRQHETDVYVSADWDNVAQQTVLSYDLLSFEPITLTAGEEKTIEGMIQRYADGNQERELECRVYVAWTK